MNNLPELTPEEQLRIVEKALKLANSRGMWEIVQDLKLARDQLLSKMPLVKIGQGEYIEEYYEDYFG